MLGQEHQEQYGSHFYQRYHIFGCVMYRSNRSLNIPPPPPSIPRAFDVFSCPGGSEFDFKT